MEDVGAFIKRGADAHDCYNGVRFIRVEPDDLPKGYVGVKVLIPKKLIDKS